MFEAVHAAGGWLQPRDPVLVVDLDGDARAYPLAILTYHEIVNDVVADQPLVVTYCPCATPGWCSSAVDGEVLDFGTSGRLWNSNLVMYDRATRCTTSSATASRSSGPMNRNPRRRARRGRGRSASPTPADRRSPRTLTVGAAPARTGRRACG